MSERRIIARAQPAGTRRLTAVPEGSVMKAAPTAPTGRAPATGGRNLSGLNQFLERAREQGAQLIATAREQAESIAQAAREQGFAAGYAEGVARAEQAIAERLALAESLVANAAQAREEAIANAERDLVELAFEVAGKIVRQRIVADPSATVGILEHALRKAYVRDGLTVLCNPADLERLAGASDQLQAKVGSLSELKLIGDRRIERGGVVVRTDAGDIDATIESQLTRLKDTLFEDRQAA